MIVINKFSRDFEEEKKFYSEMLAPFGEPTGNIRTTPFVFNSNYRHSHATGLITDTYIDIGGAVGGVITDLANRRSKSYYHGSLNIMNWYANSGGSASRIFLYLENGVSGNSQMIFRSQITIPVTTDSNLQVVIPDTMFRYIRKVSINDGGFSYDNYSEIQFVGKKIDL